MNEPRRRLAAIAAGPDDRIDVAEAALLIAQEEYLALSVNGVSCPGHFLARHIGEPEIIVDPFFGTTISADECARRNLNQVYVERNDVPRALACVDRVLLLLPDAPRELRDRGILYQCLECFAAAVRDLGRYLQLAPEDEAAATIRKALPELRRQASLLQ